MTALTEQKVRNVLNRKIVIIEDSSKLLTFIPLNQEFQIHVGEKLKTILFSIDTAVDYFNNGEIKEYVNTQTLMELRGEQLETALTTIRREKHKEYVFIELYESEENTKKAVVKSVYQRLPNKADFCKKVEIEQEKSDTSPK